jgi:cell division protein FtsB
VIFITVGSNSNDESNDKDGGAHDETVKEKDFPPSIFGIAMRRLVRRLSTNPINTFRVHQSLQNAGFPAEQSQAMITVFKQALEQSLTTTMPLVTKQELDTITQSLEMDMLKLKSDFILMEKNEIAQIVAENERLAAQVEKLHEQLRDQLTRAQAGVRLDMSLEKGRLKDESSTQEQRLRETETRIETEMASLKTQMEGIKVQILQYMLGTITGAGALILAYLRMFK